MKTFCFLAFLPALAHGAAADPCKTPAAVQCVSAFVAAGCDIQAGAPTVAGVDCASEVPVECAETACNAVVKPVERRLEHDSYTSWVTTSFTEPPVVADSVTFAVTLPGDTVVDNAFKAQMQEALLSQLSQEQIDAGATIEIVYTRVATTTMALPEGTTAAQLEVALTNQYCTAGDEACSVAVSVPSATQRRRLSEVEVAVTQDASVSASDMEALITSTDTAALAADLGVDPSLVSAPAAPTVTLNSEVTVTSPVAASDSSSSLVESFEDSSAVSGAIADKVDAVEASDIAVSEATAASPPPSPPAASPSPPPPAPAPPAEEPPVETTVAPVTDLDGEAQGVAFSSGSTLSLRAAQLVLTAACAAVFLS